MNSDEDKLYNSDADKPEEGAEDNLNDSQDQNTNENESESEEQPEPEVNTEAEDEQQESQKFILRSRSNRIFLGVCSGLGEYFDTDPLFFRLAFIISVVFGFWGILFYFILGIVIPEEPESSDTNESKKQFENENTKILIGSSLILLGLFLIVRNTRLFQFFQVWNIFAEYLVPAALIIAGLYLILRKKSPLVPHNTNLYRSVENKKIAGVCAGLGDYLDVDPTIIRILWLVFVFSSFGVGFLIYLLFAVMVPEKQEIHNEDPSEHN